MHINSSEFISQHRKSPNDFTRNRSLTFPRLICFMLNMVNGSIQSELNKFFQILQEKHSNLESVTAAAFCKARMKLSFTAFKSLNSCLTKTFYESSFVRRWNGFRLLAVDASVTTLPPSTELFNCYGKARQHGNNPAIRLSQLYDICNKITIDVQISPHSSGERELAVKHLEHASSNDIILYDRGYPATWLSILHLEKNIHFCARVTLDSSNILKDFLSSGKKETKAMFPCIEKSLRQCRRMGLPTSPIKLRLIRIELDSGDTEVLITSLLDSKKYPHKTFKNLYHQRWFVEEDYKLMKSRLELENFSGISAEAIQQDVHAKILTKNITAIAILEADVIAQQKYKDRKRTYKINFTHALSRIKDNIVRITLVLTPGIMTMQLLKQIAACVNAFRPERKFDRAKDQMRKRRQRYYMAYKRVG